MKKLIIVGNKEISYSIADEIDSFDYVVRLNRMNNFGHTGIKTDLLLTDIHVDFFKLLDSNSFNNFKYAERLLVNLDNFSIKNQLKALRLGIFMDKQFKYADKIHFTKFGLKLLDEFNIDKNMRFTNFFILVNYILQKYSEEYKIYVTCIDIDGRGQLFQKNDIWNNWHRNIGYYEEDILKEMLSEKKIFYYENPHTI